MLFKIISLGLVSCLYVQNTPILLNKSCYTNHKCISVKREHSSYYKLVASLPNKHIKLFGLSSETKGIYEKFLLDVKGKKKVFEWKSEASITFSPKLILRDINNDSIEELIITLTTGTGSDIHIEETHIINLNTLREYTVNDPLVIIKENVTTKITERDTDMLIQLEINGDKFKIEKDKKYAGVWFEDVYFGNYIHWGVTNNKLYAEIGAQVSPAGYVGTITIEYKFKDNAFVLDKIFFKKSN